MVEAKVKHDTQFYGIKGGVGVPPLPHYQQLLKEFMKCYESCSQHDQVQLPSSVTYQGFSKIDAKAYVRRYLYVFL